MTTQRILVVDDEPQIQRFLKVALTAAGYEAVLVGTGGEALKAVVTRSPDAIVLDLGLPDLDGKAVLRDIRGFSKVPVVILSARDQEAEKIEALDLGADDYVEKPFGIGELMARLRTALRHAAGAPPAPGVLRVDGLVIDQDRRMVTRDGTAVKLTPKEYDLLTTLARHAGRVLTHRQLLTQVWGPAHADDTQYLRVFIGQLRVKIEKNPAASKIIRTESGVGYRMAEGE